MRAPAIKTSYPRLEIRIRAERRLGELLRAQEKATGGQPYQKNPTGAKKEPVDTPTLADMGITKKLSSRAPIGNPYLSHRKL